MRNCGNCQYFARIRSLQWGGGLCNKYDFVTKPESGRDCQAFKTRKWDRNQDTPTEPTEPEYDTE